MAAELAGHRSHEVSRDGCDLGRQYHLFWLIIYDTYAVLHKHQHNIHLFSTDKSKNLWTGCKKTSFQRDKEGGGNIFSKGQGGRGNIFSKGQGGRGGTKIWKFCLKWLTYIPLCHKVSKASCHLKGCSTHLNNDFSRDCHCLLKAIPKSSTWRTHARPTAIISLHVEHEVLTYAVFEGSCS